MSKTFKIEGNDISDGYHTFNELYEHRHHLYISLARALNWKGFSWRTDMDGWFILYWESPAGQVSYHLPDRLLYLVENKCPNEDDKVWDGHSSNDVVHRLREALR